jgi:hypothetical protein
VRVRVSLEGVQLSLIAGRRELEVSPKAIDVQISHICSEKWKHFFGRETISFPTCYGVDRKRVAQVVNPWLIRAV